MRLKINYIPSSFEFRYKVQNGRSVYTEHRAQKIISTNVVEKLKQGKHTNQEITGVTTNHLKKILEKNKPGCFFIVSSDFPLDIFGSVTFAAL